MKKKGVQKQPRGFSLIELMIAMVVLAIGIMATMAMQFTALAGYTVARDGTGAAEIGRVIEQRLKAEALQWEPGIKEPLGFDSAYTGDGYATGSLMQSMATTPWVWQPVFTAPVDQRLATVGPRRFCAYVTGGPFVVGNSIQPTNAFKVQIAVVYPRANGTFPGATGANPDGLCTLGDTAVPVASLDPSTPNALELAGLRASYFGTVIRSH
ncbi:MAG: type IV pilus modification PilV family protein [Bradymonadaceae bacterium]